MELLNSITGKITAGVVALAVVAGAISWFQMDPATRQMLLSGAGKIAAWVGVVLFAPWVTFFATTWVAKRESNLAGAALVATYTPGETVLLAGLFGWQLPGPTAWTFLIVGMLVAGAYNLLTCDWIAEKLG